MNRTKPKSKFREAVETILMTVAAALFLKIFIVEAFRIPTGSMENTLLEGDFLFVNKFVYGLKTPKYFPFTDVRIPHFRLPPFKKPKRGDVIVFEFPGDRDEIKPREVVSYIKRCIAVGGDTVRIIDKEVYVNGRPIRDPVNVRLGGNEFLPRGFPNPRIFPKGYPFNEDNYGPLRVPKKGDVIALTPENIEGWEVFIAREGHAVTVKDGQILLDGKPTNAYRVERDYLFMMGDNRDNSLDSRFWGFVPEDNIVGEALLIYWSWNQNLPLASAEKFKSVRWWRIGTIVR